LRDPSGFDSAVRVSDLDKGLRALELNFLRAS
jgi:hypothetical protein